VRLVEAGANRRGGETANGLEGQKRRKRPTVNGERRTVNREPQYTFSRCGSALRWPRNS